MLNHPEATIEALSILRKTDNFQWYVIFMLVLVIYIYGTHLKKKDYNSICSGLMLYGIHWFVEIINALIQHYTGHALWTVPKGTSFLILIGVGVELSLMFSIAGIAAANMLLPSPKDKILGIPNRLFVGVFNAGLASVLEIFLVMTPTFVWVYPWWGSITVFVTVYIPFFVGATYAHDWKPANQRRIIGLIWAIDVFLFIFFVNIGYI